MTREKLYKANSLVSNKDKYTELLNFLEKKDKMPFLEITFNYPNRYCNYCTNKFDDEEINLMWDSIIDFVKNRIAEIDKEFIGE